MESAAIEQSVLAIADQPDFQTIPISIVERSVLDLLVSPSTVTIGNITEKYSAVRDYIKICISSGGVTLHTCVPVALLIASKLVRCVG